MPQKEITFPLSLRDCLKCWDTPRLTAWRGPPGIDPDLRQYRCPRCGEAVHIIRRGSQTANLDKLVQDNENKIKARK